MLWLVALACRPSSDPGTKVVLVVVDGVRVEESVGLTPSELSGRTGPEHWPLIHAELLPQATLIRGMRNMGTTITAPAHATLATGTRTPLANLAVDNGAGLYRPVLPTIAEELEQQGTGESVWIANQTLISPVTWSLMPGFEQDRSDFVLITSEVGEVQPSQADAPVWPKLQRTLEEERPQLVMVNLKAVDRAGHYGQPGVEPYLEAVDAVDAPLVRLWDQLQQDPWYADDTVLIITTDHGRHRDDGSAEYWRSHGDWSGGDREGFAILLGPDVLRNEVVDTPYALEDLAPTIAALTGVELPWAEGLPMQDALSVYLPTTAREGVAALAVDGSWQVEQVFTDDPAHRSVIRFRGRRLSSEEAWAAEAPAIAADGDRAAICWREVRLDEGWMPWTPRCVLVEGETVQDLRMPEAVVSSFWEADLRWREGVLQVAYAHNPYDIAQVGVEGDVGPRLARWDGGSWTQTATFGQLLYPESVQHSAESLVFVASPIGNEAREQRRLYVQEPGGEAVLLDTPLAQPVSGGWLVTRPAVRGQQILAVGVGDTERVLFVLDRGTGQDRVLSRDAELPVHLAPVWAANTPVWALQGERARVCTPEGCVDVGARIRDLDYDGSSVWVVTQEDGEPWEARAL